MTEDETQRDGEQTEMGMEDITKDTENFFLKLDIGAPPIELVLEKVVKKVDKEYHLSAVDYQMQLVTVDGKILGITAWELWKQVKAAIKESGNIRGTKLKIARIGHGKFTVELLEKAPKGESVDRYAEGTPATFG